jgi:hypothetical protein
MAYKCLTLFSYRCSCKFAITHMQEWNLLCEENVQDMFTAENSNCQS